MNARAGSSLDGPTRSSGTNLRALAGPILICMILGDDDPAAAGLPAGLCCSRFNIALSVIVLLDRACTR